ncbi:hypothetical protein G6F26_012933 [Rhizopus arrhizus]|uniref:Uncharacterized protein n=1 Tax=Rhizopus oryzae TaxID=64495 RepID=A0A9P7BL37_RHIOR|nr:hypothetical protein G6F24_013354 [Rhizopus arrhizus]KAG0775504.1 hypothetical protein G6F22_013251 [Rhizopus arrhizus]KAG0804180.1 hypothetical protein G6F20_012907 [Rhizopus arrhizus]KAG0816626.1 hypothetical protein G6F18_012983 [Rhizopus arrhizus]KAG0861839.1 hypothetical protein G6F16_012986 [Rhizopus arrhizus]
MKYYFLNETHLPIKPGNSHYKEQKLTMNEVMANVSCFTTFFEKKSVLSFAKWCYKRKLALTEGKESRKIMKGNSGSKLKFYTLYVLEKELMNSVCSSIINYLPAYKSHIMKIKDDGFQVIGYARKSPGEESEEVRIRLLQTMVDRLYERSLVDEVFVSPCSKASDPMKARDSKVNQATLNKISRVRGTTKDMIEFIKKSDKKVCLVAIDFAGLTTNCSDLQSFVSEHEQLEKIIIDNLPWENEVTIIDRKEIEKNEEVLQVFDCRERPIQRSK